MNSDNEPVIQTLQAALERLARADLYTGLAISAIMKDQWEHPERADRYANWRQQLEILNFRLNDAYGGLCAHINRVKGRDAVQEESLKTGT